MVDVNAASEALTKLKDQERKPVDPAKYPPMPPTELLPDGYQWVFVDERIDKRGMKTAPHWRKWPIKMKAFKKAKSPPRPVGRPPKVVRPQFTGQVHATHVYEQLAVPLAYFAGSPETGFGPRHDAIRACIKAIEDARTFINRFTGDGNGNEPE